MSLTLVAEMWLAVKESIISSDRSVVADNVISMSSYNSQKYCYKS